MTHAGHEQFKYEFFSLSGTDRVKHTHCRKMNVVVVTEQCQTGVQNRFQNAILARRRNDFIAISILFFAEKNVRRVQFDFKAYFIYLKVQLWRVCLPESEENEQKQTKQNN